MQMHVLPRLQPRVQLPRRRRVAHQVGRLLGRVLVRPQLPKRRGTRSPLLAAPAGRRAVHGRLGGRSSACASARAATRAAAARAGGRSALRALLRGALLRSGWRWCGVHRRRGTRRGLGVAAGSTLRLQRAREGGRRRGAARAQRTLLAAIIASRSSSLMMAVPSFVAFLCLLPSSTGRPSSSWSPAMRCVVLPLTADVTRAP